MAGHEMIRKLAIAITVVSVYGGASASTSAISNDALDADRAGGAQAGPQAFSISANPAAPVQILVSPPAPVASTSAQALSANPLWAIPLAQLPVTRDRPIFSPSRRPPPPAVAPAAAPKVATPVRTREPERPQLSLIGTVASDEEGFAIFLDQSTKAALRLKVGEDYQGWKLRSIQGREATLEKDQRAAVLTLPLPGAGPSGEVRLLPASAVKMPLATRQ